MISVTRLNGSRFVLNAEIIRTVESNPDTIVTLITGERLVVTESMDEVVRKAVEYHRVLRRALGELPPVQGDGTHDPSAPRERAG